MNISANGELNWTLEDGRWKDSFDRLLEEKPALIEVNVLKKNVRASYNIDSSIENSKDAPGFFKESKRLKKTTKTISTPVEKQFKHPFKCKISPINVNTSKSLFKLNNAMKKRQQYASKNLQSTILHPSAIVVDYSSIRQTSLVNNSKEDSLEILLSQPKKVGKLSRIRSCNVPVKDFEFVRNVKAKTYRKESKKRQIGVKISAKNNNKSKTISQNLEAVGGKTLKKSLASSKISTKKAFAIKNIDKATEKPSTQQSGSSLVCVQLSKNKSSNSKMLTSANDEQVCSNTSLGVTNTNGKSAVSQVKSVKSKKCQNMDQEAVEVNVISEPSAKAVSSAKTTADIADKTKKTNLKKRKDLTGESGSKNTDVQFDLLMNSIAEVADCSVELSMETEILSKRQTICNASLDESQSAKKLSSRNTSSSLRESSDALFCPGTRRIKTTYSDDRVSVRKSRKNFKELPSTVNGSMDKTNNFSTTSIIIHENVPETIKRRQSRRTTRQTNNAVNENIIESEIFTVQNEIFSPNERKSRNTLALPDIDASKNSILQFNVSPESVLDREPPHTSNACNLNHISDTVAVLSEQSIQNNDKLTTLNNNTELIKSQRQSSRRTLRRTMILLTGNSIEAMSLTAQTVQCLNQNMQVYEEISPKSRLQKSSSETLENKKNSDAMVTVGKSNNCVNSLPASISDQCVQIHDSLSSSDCNFEKTESRRRRSNRQALRLTKTDLIENSVSDASLTTQSVDSINVNMAVCAESSLEGASLTVTKSGTLNRISEARKSNNSLNDILHIHISENGDNSVVPVINTDAIDNLAARPMSNPGIETLQRSIVEITPSTMTRSRISNPMVTVRKKSSLRRNTDSDRGRNKPDKIVQHANIGKLTEEESPTEQRNVYFDENPSTNSLKNLESSMKTEKSSERRISNLTVERRRNRFKQTSETNKAILATSRAFNSRSYGRTLSSVQEIVDDNEHKEQNTLQMPKDVIPVESFVQRKTRTVKFIDAPCKSPPKQRQKSAEAQNNDSDVVFIEGNEQNEQSKNVNRQASKRSALRVEETSTQFLSPLKSANPSKSINGFKADESFRNLTVNISLQTGKWRKSLSVLRRSQMSQAQNRQSNYRHICQLQSVVDDDEDQSVEFVGNTTFVGTRKTILITPEDVTLPQQSFVNITDHKERVLRYCNQNSALSFGALYAKEAMQNCLKIGEGVYGEVFIKKVEKDFVVCKIIPIEGSVLVNGEVQKTFEQILPEIVISKELAKLKKDASNINNTTPGFVDIKKVACVEGKYPQHLIKCWETYDNDKTSENDNPKDFPEKQLYVVLELEFVGKDLESFVFNNAEQSYATLQQIVLTLAVAEEALEFEHRDLHWGNVLIKQTNDTVIQYKLSGETLTVPTKGIKATIIDYTLSRMKYDNHCFYNDLANDEELFTVTGDYQFDIYRMMRDVLGTNWERFEPKTNVFWLSYIISKMENGVKYKNTRSKIHAQHLSKIGTLKNIVLDFDSACSFVKHMLIKS